MSKNDKSDLVAKQFGQVSMFEDRRQIERRNNPADQINNQRRKRERRASDYCTIPWWLRVSYTEKVDYDEFKSLILKKKASKR